MFLKSYKLKLNAPLKGSEAKRLRLRLEKDFDLTVEQLTDLLPKVANITLLKLIAHSDEQINVYCVDKLPMFFEIEDNRLVPTLYALWKQANLLPYFTTFSDVLPRLSNGATLMLPGVVPQGTGMNIYGRYKKDQLVAVNLVDNKAAVGVGVLLRSSDDLYMSGAHGPAIKILHIFGDKLWGHEPALAQQLPLIKTKELKHEDFPELGTNIKTNKSTNTIVQTFANISLQASKTEDVYKEENTKPDTENIGSNSTCDYISADIVEEAPQMEVTAEDVLKRAFLTALKNHGKTLQLPLLTSNFYRLYVVPAATEHIDIKKTKYKKVSNFLNEMVEQAFIVVREESKGVDKITSIDFEHPELVNFITDVKDPSKENESSEQNPLFHSELVEMYVVSDTTAPFFTKLNYKRGEGIPATQIKKIIREYISKNQLPTVNAITKSIKLDATMQEICKCPEATLNEIVSAIINKMEHSYRMCTLKDISHNKPQIQMSLATRSGNKKVTLVSNVECYGIIISEFIKLCKQGAAASTTVVQLPNQNKEQLQIQGNQIRFVYNLLTETYKVQPKCIVGLELAKDGKKHKKK